MSVFLVSDFTEQFIASINFRYFCIIKTIIRDRKFDISLFEKKKKQYKVFPECHRYYYKALIKALG